VATARENIRLPIGDLAKDSDTDRMGRVKAVASSRAPGGFFIADQRETPVGELKAGQWVYLRDYSRWFELAKDAQDRFTVPLGKGHHASAVRLRLTGVTKPLMFLASVSLWARTDEEGN
jgi:hypothetical protein